MRCHCPTLYQASLHQFEADHTETCTHAVAAKLSILPNPTRLLQLLMSPSKGLPNGHAMQISLLACYWQPTGRCFFHTPLSKLSSIPPFDMISLHLHDHYMDIYGCTLRRVLGYQYMPCSVFDQVLSAYQLRRMPASGTSGSTSTKEVLMVPRVLPLKSPTRADLIATTGCPPCSAIYALLPTSQ